jgi:hypothetical protein
VRLGRVFSRVTRVVLVQPRRRERVGVPHPPQGSVREGRAGGVGREVRQEREGGVHGEGEGEGEGESEGEGGGGVVQKAVNTICDGMFRSVCKVCFDVLWWSWLCVSKDGRDGRRPGGGSRFQCRAVSQSVVYLLVLMLQVDNDDRLCCVARDVMWSETRRYC